MPENKTKRIFADVSLETRNRFLAKARMQETTGQALIETWVSEYIGDLRHTVPDQHQRWIEKLIYILQHGDTSTRNVVTSNLTLFENVVRLQKNK